MGDSGGDLLEIKGLGLRVPFAGQSLLPLAFPSVGTHCSASLTLASCWRPPSRGTGASLTLAACGGRPAKSKGQC